MRLNLLARGALYFRIFRELISYDATDALLGFAVIRRRLKRPNRGPDHAAPGLEKIVCDAVRDVAPFYWKRVQCLQRSVVTARILRAYGAGAELVIGYRPAPFLGHAWVELGGKIVSDSTSFQSRLLVLERL